MRRSSIAHALPLAFAPFLAACAAKAPEVRPWADTFVCSSGQASTSLAVDPTGAIALAGSYTGQLTVGDVALPQVTDPNTEIFAGMLNADGTVAWAVNSNGSEAQAVTGQDVASVAFDPAGSVLFAGSFDGTLDFGTGPLTALSDDTFVVKLGHDGHAVWAKDFSADDGGPSGAGVSSPAAVAVNASGDVAIGGIFSGTVGFGGAPLFAAPGVGQSGFVALLDGDGGPLFSMDFGGGATGVTSLAFDPAGDLYVGGINDGTLTAGGTVLTTSTTSGYVVKLSPDGVPQWAIQLDGDGSTVAGLAVDAGGNVVVAGTFQGSLVVGNLTADATSAGGGDGVALQISAAGTPLWLKTFSDAPLTTIAAPSSGGALVTGSYTGAPDFGAGPLPQSTGPVLFAARLGAQGELVSTQELQVPTQDAPSGFMQPNLVTGMGAVGSDAVIAGSYNGLLDIEGMGLMATGPGDLFVARFPL